MRWSRQKLKTKYDEWIRRKLEEERKHQIQKEEEKQKANEQYRQKLSSSQEAYKQWLKKSKKQRSHRNTYAYSGGSLFTYYDMGCTPPPEFVNPVPWVDCERTNYDNSIDTSKFSSPPLLWKDVAKRESPRKRKTKQRKIATKHSCVDMT